MGAQLRLFPLMKPLIERFGNDFFLNAPREPGVCVMRGAGERILYIGQSRNLRTRLAFYKNANPDRLPRRLVRLVHQVEAIVWERCPTAEAARSRELELLQIHRPRFNRADVGPQFFHYVNAREEGGAFKIDLHFDPPLLPQEEKWLGPVKGKMIPCLALAALQRLWFGALRQPKSCSDLPLIPKRLNSISLEGQLDLHPELCGFLAGRGEVLVTRLLELQSPDAEPVLRQLNECDAELLLSWARAISQSI